MLFMLASSRDYYLKLRGFFRLNNNTIYKDI